MNGVDAVFKTLRAEGRKAFIPFVTAGDPDLNVTVRLIDELARRGANLIEVGIPYSDPIADGPVIQASYTRALERKLNLDSIWNAIGNYSQSQRERLVPLVTMVSYAIVHRHGLARFVEQSKRAGFEGSIVPDLPIEEADELAAIAARNDFKLILLITPTTPRERAVAIARRSSGFIYYVSVTGITGERAVIAPNVIEQVKWLKTQTQLPVCIGFGISRPEHVRMLAPIADGIIVGSAIVRRVAEGAVGSPDDVTRTVGDYVASLIAALS